MIVTVQIDSERLQKVIETLEDHASEYGGENYTEEFREALGISFPKLTSTN